VPRIVHHRPASGKDGRWRSPEPGLPDPGFLLRLAAARPRAAVVEVGRYLAARPPPAWAAVAKQALGIALRDLGRPDEALAALRSAARLAELSGDGDLLADVRASLAAALVLAGRTRAGLRQFDLAVAGGSGLVLARVRVRLGATLDMLGRPADGLVELNRAIRELHRTGDRVWEARALLNRSMCAIAEGSPGAAVRADADARRAGELYEAAGYPVGAAKARHNRGVAAYLAGSLPVALAHLTAADSRYAALDVDVPELATDRCQVLLTAGLAVDALAEVDRALARRPLPGYRLELLHAGAVAALAAGDPRDAVDRARATAAVARRQRHRRWSTRAAATAVAARVAAGEHGPGIARDAAVSASHVSRDDPPGAPLALLLAGRAALDPACRPLVRSRGAAQLARVAAGRRRGTALARSTAWLAEALLRESSGNFRGVLVACARGLDAVDEHLATLGAAELRAAGTMHGAELATIALREAVRSGDARTLLWWSERWRATALAAPPVRPPDDPRLAADLGSLRDTIRRLADAVAAGEPIGALTAERTRVESAVRRRRLEVQAGLKVQAGLEVRGRLEAQGGLEVQGGLKVREARTTVGPGEPTAVVAALGEAILIELVEVDGTLHAVVAGNGPLRRYTVGPVRAAMTEVEFAAFALARAAHGRVPDLARTGERLQRALLGDDVRLPPGRPVVVVPPGRLLTAPWALLPALAGIAVSVAPSGALWARSRSAADLGAAGLGRSASGCSGQERRTVLVAGPDLPGSTAEIDALGVLHPAAQVLTGDRATADSVLRALDGAWLVDIAAHGTFRADNPLFSSLTLADGPLTVHDLDRLARSPHRVVLSACESADGAAVGADELLGLTGALLRLGTWGVLAATGPVNDTATAGVVAAVHRSLLAGHGLPEALADARADAAGNALAAATAASFLAVGC